MEPNRPQIPQERPWVLLFIICVTLDIIGMASMVFPVFELLGLCI